MRQSRTRLAAVATSAALILGVAGCGIFGDDTGKDRTAAGKAATDFLAAWQRGDAAGAAALTDNAAAAQGALAELTSGLGVRSAKIAPGALTPASGEPTGMPFDVTLTLGGIGDFAYGSTLRVVKPSGLDDAAKKIDDGWRVRWAPTVLHPQLTAATRLSRVRTLPPRAAIEAADGSVLRAPAAIVGSVGPATKQALADAGPNASATDEVGLTGLQHTYQRRLAGTPGGAVRLVDRASGATVSTLKDFPSTPGQPVRTTIDPHVQALAERAVADGPKKGNVTAFVVLRPSTGAVLAVVNSPAGGYDSALAGQYAPGSTFKVVTSTALFGAGMSPTDPTPCQETVTINGRTFHNADNEHPGVVSLAQAFAISCNTAFISQNSRIGLGSLSTTAKDFFGLGQPWHVGVPNFSGSVPVARGRDSLGAFMIGQDEVTMSPLAMTSVAATVESGSFHQPVLVSDPAPTDLAQASPLPAGAADRLRSMMRLVTASGTAAPALAGKTPADVGVKTGTAETSATDPNAWMIGFHHDLAFGGLVVKGGFGVTAVGPIVRELLANLG